YEKSPKPGDFYFQISSTQPSKGVPDVFFKECQAGDHVTTSRRVQALRTYCPDSDVVHVNRDEPICGGPTPDAYSRDSNTHVSRLHFDRQLPVPDDTGRKNRPND